MEEEGRGLLLRNGHADDVALEKDALGDAAMIVWLLLWTLLIVQVAVEIVWTIWCERRSRESMHLGLDAEKGNLQKRSFVVWK